MHTEKGRNIHFGVFFARRFRTPESTVLTFLDQGATFKRSTIFFSALLRFSIFASDSHTKKVRKKRFSKRSSAISFDFYVDPKTPLEPHGKTASEKKIQK
jgi:hypothetical protein